MRTIITRMGKRLGFYTILTWPGAEDFYKGFFPRHKAGLLEKRAEAILSSMSMLDN